MPVVIVDKKKEGFSGILEVLVGFWVDLEYR
jgi:hypothetical protein